MAENSSFRSQFNNQQHSREHNSGVRHPDFNDSVRTTIGEFIDAFMQGTSLENYYRHVEYDDNPSIDDDMNNVFDDPFNKDIIDVNDNINQLIDATTNNDDASTAD
jgi:hypothetical protein